jgi:hypothetical protein
MRRERIEEKTIAKTAVAIDWQSRHVRHKALFGDSARQCEPSSGPVGGTPQKCIACRRTALINRAIHNQGRNFPRAVLVRIFTIYVSF